MRKIPTLFVRDENDRKHVTAEVTPGCEWVLAGEGTATRKWDGTCVCFDGERWWARREVNPGKSAPSDFVEVEHDATTGKTVGWEPAEASGFAKYLQEALDTTPVARAPGTYELVGPRINGNPEGFATHWLIHHGNMNDEDAHRAERIGRDYGDLAHFLLVERDDWEGIVWHHPDGRMAKIKRRDFA